MEEEQWQHRGTDFSGVCSYLERSMQYWKQGRGLEDTAAPWMLESIAVWKVCDTHGILMCISTIIHIHIVYTTDLVYSVLCDQRLFIVRNLCYNQLQEFIILSKSMQPRIIPLVSPIANGKITWNYLRCDVTFPTKSVVVWRVSRKFAGGLQEWRNRQLSVKSKAVRSFKMGGVELENFG